MGATERSMERYAAGTESGRNTERMRGWRADKKHGAGDGDGEDGDRQQHRPGCHSRTLCPVTEPWHAGRETDRPSMQLLPSLPLCRHSNIRPADIVTTRLYAYIHYALPTFNTPCLHSLCSAYIQYALPTFTMLCLHSLHLAYIHYALCRCTGLRFGNTNSTSSHQRVHTTDLKITG